MSFPQPHLPGFTAIFVHLQSAPHPHMYSAPALVSLDDGAVDVQETRTKEHASANTQVSEFIVFICSGCP